MNSRCSSRAKILSPTTRRQKQKEILSPGGERGAMRGTEQRRALELLAAARMAFLLLPPCVGDRTRPGGLHPLFTRGKLVFASRECTSTVVSLIPHKHANSFCLS